MRSERKSFGECAQLMHDSYVPSECENLPYIGLEHIEQQSLRLNGIGNSSETISNKFRFRRGDILFGKLRPYFRKVVMPNFDGVCSTDIFVVRARKGADQRFLYYWMASEDFIAYATAGSEGTKMPRAKWEFLERLEKDLPLLPEQQRTGEILGALDDKIELNMRMNKTLEAMAAAIFKSWFIDFEPFQDGEFVDSEVGPIPKGWEVGSILDCADLLSGGTPKTEILEYWDGDIAWVSARDVTSASGTFILDTEKKITQVGVENSNAKILPKNTTIVTARGTVGSYCLLGREMAINQTNYGLKAKAGIGDFFVFFSIANLVNQMKQNAYGTVFDTITTRTFKEMQIVIPSKAVAKLFEERVEGITTTVLSNLQESRTLAQIRDTLLPKLLNGEICTV